MTFKRFDFYINQNKKLFQMSIKRADSLFSVKYKLFSQSFLHVLTKATPLLREILIDELSRYLDEKRLQEILQN